MDYKRYFQEYDFYFWKLDQYKNDSGILEYVYEIPEFGSIAYAKYVIDVLENFAEESIPPFGSLLLAIAATKIDAESTLFQLNKIAKEKEISREFPNANLFSVDQAFEFLKMLSQLPSQYKTGQKRISLIKVIFENCHNSLSAEKAKKIVIEYKNSLFSHDEKINKIPLNQLNFVKDFRTVALLKLKFPSVEAIIKAMEGLPETEEIQNSLNEDILEQENESKTDFIQELIEDQKTFHVGSLIKRIWSGLKIPFHHNIPSDQPLGGVADITNKGDFDKLLISEFANDDLIFMQRIANNEALYIEREVPPSKDKFTRDILIDISIKNWGNPKVVAFATALSIAKHPKTDIACKLFAVGTNYTEIGFKNVHEVIDGLGILSGKIDCTEGLNSYFTSHHEKVKQKETFLILSEDSYKTEKFQKTLYENLDLIQFILLTATNGDISFYKIANRTKKQIQKIRLPLEDLWDKSKPKKPIQHSIKNHDLPILYPAERSYNGIMYCDGIYYTIINKNLYAFAKEDHFKKAYTKIDDNLPFENGEYVMIKNEYNELNIVHYSEYYNKRINYL